MVVVGASDGLRVREERLRRGWSQTDLTLRTGLPASAISGIERGRLYLFPGYRRRIAQAFGIAESELFGPRQEGAEK